MEAQHHAAVRVNGTIFNKTAHHASQSSTRLNWRRYDHIPNGTASFPPRIPPGAGLTNTEKSQEVRDDVYASTSSSSTLTGGLSEVTNRLDHRAAAGPRRLWSAHRYESYGSKKLSTNAYSSRFPPVARPTGQRDLANITATSRQAAYNATYWRDREELARRHFFRREDNAAKQYMSKQHAHPARMPSPPFAGTKSAARLAHYSAMRAMENRAHATQRAELRKSPTHDTRRNNELVRGYSGSSGTMDAQAYDQSGSRNPTMDAQAYDQSGSRNPKARVEGDSSHKRKYDMADDGRYIVDDPSAKKEKSCMLDILCSATLELGPIQDNPSTGCSCPRSNCIKLYCDCFKAGSPCSDICSCINCKNTEEETRVDGERIRAIKNTLARNPRAFTGGKKEAVPQNPGDVVCNCLKSRCLKLYCHCFHKGRTCNEACLCISCLNTTSESSIGGRRHQAIQNCLEKRPDAFTKQPKEVGSGCACKNNKCLKKYCDCFRFELSCSEKCVCKDCGNGKNVISV